MHCHYTVGVCSSRSLLHGTLCLYVLRSRVLAMFTSVSVAIDLHFMVAQDMDRLPFTSYWSDLSSPAAAARRPKANQTLHPTTHKLTRSRPHTGIKIQRVRGADATDWHVRLPAATILASQKRKRLVNGHVKQRGLGWRVFYSLKGQSRCTTSWYIFPFEILIVQLWRLKFSNWST